MIPTTSVVTWQEMGYFSLFSIAVLALYFAVLIPLTFMLGPASSLFAP